MSEQNHLYLVDASAYIFRAYHRLPPLTNPEGTPVGAVYGYTTMLWKLADDLHQANGPTHMAVILDKSSKSFRNDLYDQYKANRPPPPDDLVPQFPLIRDATRAFSLPVIEEENVEADDMIASYAKAAMAQGWKVTIVSSDKDLMQLIEPKDDSSVDMLDTMKNMRIARAEVVEKFGVGPELVGDMLALMGDSADNIPGVKGIGPKTATKLLIEHGDLESVLAAAQDMKKSKMRENLIEFAQDARLSRILVTLKDDCPLPVALDDFKLQDIPKEPLAEFLATHGFSSLLRKLGADAPEAVHTGHDGANDGSEGSRNNLPGTTAPRPPEQPPINPDDYVCITDTDTLKIWLDEARAIGTVAFDTETTSLDPMRAELVGFSLASAPGKACYVPLHHGGTDLLDEKPQQIAMADALALLKPLLEDDAVLKIGQNIKYDMNVMAQHDIAITPVDDTMVMSFALDAGRAMGGHGGHGMDALAKEHLGHDCISYKSVTGTGKSQIGFGQVPLELATRYAAEDADITLRLWQIMKPRLSAEGGTKVYEMVDRPVLPILAHMEREGIKVDRERLASLSAEFASIMDEREKEIHEIAGEPFTIGSPKQLGEILFGKLGLKGGKKGKSGQYSTDVTVLERLAQDGHDIARKVLDWRQMSKLKSTYTDALQDDINPKTGRVHTSYSLVGAQTGRLSSNDPNLQNIPIRSEMGRQIRYAFVAEPGNVILAADYSQIELRLAAHMADVDTLRQAFADGEDIHNRTAQELFGEVSRDTRGRAKTINFAILYGISRWGLAGRLEVSADEAQDMINRYFERFPGINRYISDTLQSTKERLYTETLFGRKTHFPRINAKNQTERQGSERAAINAPIQGTSADIIKRAMTRMPAALKTAGLHDVRMLLQVHDELVFELPEKDVDAASEVIRNVMANAAQPAITLTVPLEIDIGTGPSWGDAH